jgi:hypothetical protein
VPDPEPVTAADGPGHWPLAVTEPEPVSEAVTAPVAVTEPVAVAEPVAAVEAPAPAVSEPAILVADLAAAHTAVAAVAAAESAKPPTLDARDAAASAEIKEVRADAVKAVHFSDDEEAFFKAGHADQSKPIPKLESFDDLDEGYQPQTFWERLRGSKKPTK